MTRNGKIARLPKTIRDELNRRLDNNEPGKNLVAWLNSLPEVQTIIKSEFEGIPIREQNLSEWKKGGYADWQKRQETCEWLNQLKEKATDMEAIIRCSDFNHNLALVLTTDLAREMKNVMEITDPVKRVDCLVRLAGRITQFRREESNSTHARIAAEKWAREVARIEDQEERLRKTRPLHALLLERVHLEDHSEPIAKTTALEYRVNESHPTESESIRPNESN